MKLIKKVCLIAALAGPALVLAGCAAFTTAGSSSAELDQIFAQMMKASFRDQGIAKVARLDQDAANQACSAIGVNALDKKIADAIEDAALKAVKQPASGIYIGDWREGEKLAQNGRGMTWSDASEATTSNGGNCYNCHRINGTELSYGTIGPSLYQYGKLRGVADPASAQSKAIVEYTWNKLYNAKAYNACSGMPRFGHAGLMSEKQLQDLMALLLDPKSAVNQ